MYRILAVLSIAFLLLNPAGICAGTNGGVAKAPAHPCCPSTPSSCICIDRQPAPPALPSLADTGIVVPPAPIALLSSADQPVRVMAAAESGVFPTESRFLQFHQILV